MNRWPPSFLLLCLAGFSMLAVSTAGEVDSALRVSQRARALQPGEVVAFTVTSPQPLMKLQAKAFGKSFAFVGDDSGMSWMGLVGIDLGVKPGSHLVQLIGETASGEIQTEQNLKVQSKSFPTRRLTVDEKYVNPPQEVRERIQRESRKISKIFSTITEKRHWNGNWDLPVPGAATSGFGKRSILNGRPRSPHTGTDFDAEAGTPVRSPNQGRVVLAEELYYSGNTVILDHGQGLYSYFAHLSGYDCSVGDQVEKGKVVGYVGATGRVTGPHLHWTVRLVETRVDPLSLIAALGLDEG